MTDGLHQSVMRDVIEQPADVKLQHPIMPPTASAGDLKGLMGRLPRPVTVGVRVKVRLQHRLQAELHHCLGDAVRDRRDPQGPLTARLLRNHDRLHRGRKVAPRGHPIPNPIQVILEVLLELLKRFLIHPRRPSVGFHQPVCLPYRLLGNFKRLCCDHLFLPSLVDKPFSQITQPLRSRPITGPSPLLQVGPPLRPASVLWALRGLPLAVSLHIGIAGSRSSA
jgi:hypothetical protein